MIIRTNQYVIRSIVEDDLNNLKTLSQDEEILKYIPNAYNYIKCFYDAPVTNGLYLAVENAEGDFLGVVIATRERPEQYDITYFLAPEHRGKKHMVSILRLLITWMKKNNLCESLSFKIEAQNLASIAVAEKLGAEIAMELMCGNRYYWLTLNEPVQ